MLPLKESLLFPGIQSIHLIGIAMLVGATVIVDLRVLGYALPRHDVAEIHHRFVPWMRAGLAAMLITGPILFAADVSRYSRNPAFLVKMALLTAALLFHVTQHDRSAPRTKLLAVTSIALWTAVVLGGRAIADFDV
jgi:hypothetical protein